MSIRDLVRKLMRRPEPAQPGVGQVIQEREQANARQRLLDQAERLRDTQWHRVPTQIAPAVRMPLDQRTGYGTRGHR
ncbi:hypothetical protein ACGFI9_29310 [Micromonospora sp. NPDC048930]|uniref:hypothetical protein n=1 Tax=Micromonospora sp. NPDC048930 TaxID=3364261 RepID=UPI003722485C